jgi:subtilisin family serine protease
VSVLPLRVADDEGSFSLSGAVESIQYAVKMKAHVISGSWGSYIDSPALKEAIHQAQVAGVLYVASAGNSTSDLDAKPRFPASYGLEYDNMIVVAATDNRDELTDYSSYGLKTAQLAAPGTNILSTVPGGKYDHYSGTSMSTPHVAGAAALLMSAHPEWTYADVKKHLVESVDKLSTLEGKVSSGGRLNVRKALGL